MCLSSKAIHLKIAENLSTEAFRKFVACRGKPLSMISDNGTQFLTEDYLLALREQAQKVSPSYCVSRKGEISQIY